jgi:SulP family sulfate permease
MSSSFFRFRPRLVDCLRGYSRRDFSADLVAGLTVGFVALPLAMAFGIASGVDPKAGLYTAIVAGLIISLLGGSRVQVGGPTGAFVAIVYGIIAQHGVNNLVVCTIMAGVILLIMGVARMGAMVKYIPYPVTMGFTAGIAVLILSTQVRDFFGFNLETVPPGFVEKLEVFWGVWRSVHVPTVVLAASSLGLILFWPARWGRVVPGTLVALVVGSVAVVLLGLDQRWGVETIGSRFGGIPSAMPSPGLPDLSFAAMRELVRPATTIALLAAIESLLCAVVADGMIEDRHDSNQELMAQGLANIGAALFGGIPATGAIARTATNVRSGARTPVAGVIHSLTLMGLVLLAAPLASRVPLATLSGVLVATGLRMGEWHQFVRLRRWPRSDAVVFLTAFSLTVLVDLTVAVEVGLVLASFLFIKRIAETTQVSAVDERTETEGAHQSLVGKRVPEGVMVYRIFGAFFFGAADKLETALNRAQQEPRVLVLRMRKVLAMDATGLNALEDLHGKLRAKGRHLVLSGPHTQPLLVMDRAGFLDRLGRDNVCADIELALKRATVLLEQGG